MSDKSLISNPSGRKKLVSDGQQGKNGNRRPVATKRQSAIRARVTELERASLALQKTIDEVSRLQTLTDFIPRALRIVAEAFGVASAGYFEHPGETIYLRYWLFENKIYGPEELPGLDPDRYDLMRYMAAGFTVPVDHLGVHFRKRSSPSIVHHQIATASPALHEFCRRMGWGWELNVPLMVNGLADGAITLFRPQEIPFTEADFSLAESLAKQIALAMQTSLLARRERAIAIAREQEQAARQRADELSKANVALRATLAQLASHSDPQAFLGIVLIEASRQLNADAGHLATIDETDAQVVTCAHSAGEQLLPLEAFPSVVPVSEVAALPVMAAAAGPRAFDLNTEQHLFMPGTLEWHKQFGSRTVLTVPMILGRKMVGFLGFAFRREVVLTPEKAELLMALAQQAALATELIRLSQKEKSAAVAREREQVAQERAEELAKANDALQATVDATSRVLELDELVPEVLSIIGEVFETDNCAIFENLPSGEVRLWYWHFGGKTMLPAELLQLDEEKHSLIRRLAAGFTVPLEYLGIDSRIAGTVYLDHVKGTVVPEFDQWATANGLDLELNIGIATQGVRCATLCVYRERGRPFSPREIVLAEALARQIGLAMQVTKLSQTSLETAVAREREQAAEQRALELAKSNLALQESIDALGLINNLNDFLPAVLGIVGRTFGAVSCAYYEHLQNETVFLRYWSYDGFIYNPEDLANLDSARFGLVKQLAAGFTVPPDYLGHSVRAQTRAVVVDHLAATRVPPFDAFAINPVWDCELNVPLVVNGLADGAICIYRSAGVGFTTQEVELAETLAKQLAMALTASRIAERERAATLALEQERAVQQRLAELAKANYALQESIDSLGTVEDLDDFVPQVLTVITRTFGAISSAFFEHRVDETIFLRYWLFEGKVFNPDELLKVDPVRFGLAKQLATGFTAPVEYLGTTPRNRTKAVMIDHLAGTCVPEFDNYALTLGLAVELNVPLVVNGIAEGAINIYRGKHQSFSEEEVALAETLAKQMAIAMTACRLANQARLKAVETAVAREKEQAERLRANDALAINQLLQGMVDASRQLLDAGNFQSGLRDWLGILAGAVKADHAIFGNFAPPQDDANTSLFKVDWAKPGQEQRDGFPVPATAEFLGWTERLKRGESIQAHYEDLRQEESKRFWEQTDCASKILMPIVVDQHTAGWLAFNWRTHHELKPAYLALLQNAAAGAAAAIRRDNAVKIMLAEREQAAKDRAIELSKANSVLRRGLDQLATSGEIEKLLASMLAEAVNLSGAHAGALFIRTGIGSEMVLGCHFPAGPPDALAALAANIRNVSARDATGLLADTLSREFTLVDLQESITRGMCSEAAAYHRSQGHQIGWHLTLRVGGRAIGFVALAFQQPAVPSDSIRETLNAITQQMAMALELNRLGEDAKVLAVTRERELAAENRAAELAKTNHALRNSISRLVERPDLKCFIEQMLKDTALQVNAVSNLLFKVEPESQALTPFAFIHHGRAVDLALDDRFAVFRKPLDGRETCSTELLSNSASELWIDLGQAVEKIPAAVMAFHQALGHAAAFVLPLVAGERTIALMALCFTTPRDILCERLELVRALTQQMTLALELSGLSLAARSAAILEERNRLAREIHDTIAQGLTGVISQLETVAEALPPDQTQISARVNKAKDIAKTSLAEARRSVWALHPPELDGCGLLAALENLAGKAAAENGLSCEFKIKGEPFTIPFELELDLYRIANEAVRNALKHSEASRLHIIAEFRPEQFCIRITDNGRGIKESKPGQASASFGLISMRERAERCGGTLKITSAPEEGTEVVVAVPRHQFPG